MILSTIVRLILAALIFVGLFYWLVSAYPGWFEYIFLGTLLVAAIGLGSALLIFTPIEAICWAKGVSGFLTTLLVLASGAIVIFAVRAVSALLWGGPFLPEMGPALWPWVAAGVVWALIWRLTALPTIPLRRRARGN